jgi:hypothetical protein
MPVAAPIALIGWLPVSYFLFRLLPVRIAILANFLGGWMLLPSANYHPVNEPFPYWILGTCLPSTYFLTKVVVVGFTGATGMLAVDFSSFRRFRPRIQDVPMALWCAAPAIATFANRLSIWHGLRDTAYVIVAWGPPYVAGRVLFSDRPSMVLAIRAIVIAGLAYVPLCLFEWLTGPILYAVVYGYQPYQLVGATRYFGFRPVGFLEDGNQLGVWMAGSALLAWPLSRSNCRKLIGIECRLAAAVLTVTTILCQSVGSILLLGFLLPFSISGRRLIVRRLWLFLSLALAIIMCIRLTNKGSLRTVTERSVVLREISSSLKKAGRQSFGWRLLQDEKYARLAIRHPVFGYGVTNWWSQQPGSRPWGLWLLIMGAYGGIGLLGAGGIFVAQLTTTLGTRDSAREGNDAILAALGSFTLLVVLDCFLNGSLILPYMIVIGGSVRFRSTESDHVLLNPVSET